MKHKSIIIPFIALILVACASIRTQAPTKVIVLTNTFSPQSPTLKPASTLVETSTATVAPSIPNPTPTHPILFTPAPDLIQDFSGNYQLDDWAGAKCNLYIKSDATFNIKFIATNGYSEIVDGTIYFGDKRFFLNSAMLGHSDMPTWCFPKAFVLVYWGERKYLLVDNRDTFSASFISDFCTSSKNSDQLQDVGYYFYRKFDLSLNTVGSPLLYGGQLLCP